jgi:uncharacterized protein YcbK (DUF882 family)
MVRLVLFGLIAVSAGLSATFGASAETRSLKLYYIHTKERAEIVFKRNGRYDQAGLKKLNRFLRDWRRNEPTKMDPRLFDLVWEVYQANQCPGLYPCCLGLPIACNQCMLRRTRGGQASKSQHMVGKAMDFYIPGVKISKLREIGMKLQGGGVGYYPKSGSPFVHLDVAGVRAWPRMSRKELTRLFPGGKTLHLPPDGKRLPGYNVALAEYKARGGAIVSSGGGNSNSRRSGGGLLAALFGGGDEDEEPDAIAAAPKPVPAPPRTDIAALPVAAAAPEPAAASVPELPVNAPVPVARPAIEQPTVVAALAPPTPVLPAQAEIDAFAAAAECEVPSPGNEAVDLSLIRAPIPQLLAERAAPAVEKPVAVEVAALPEPDQIRARMLAGAEPVVAVQTAEPTEVASRTLVSGDAIVSEPVLAKLPSGEDFVPLPIRRPGDRPADRVADRPAQVEMAALVPVERGRRPVAATTVSSKGNRPNAASAADQPQRTAIRTEPKLTETIISNWALTRERVKTMPTPPASARRFVVSQLRAAPKVVYANGFAPNGRELPHNQFTGSAVNFISVARFGN